jgi:hydrogenase maturation protease
VTVSDNYQLTVEDAIDVSEHDVVWFVDAAKTGDAPFDVREVSPVAAIEFTSHLVCPEAVMAIAQQCYGASPQAFLLAVRGYEFSFVEALTPAAADNLDAALAMLTGRLRRPVEPAA